MPMLAVGEDKSSRAGVVLPTAAQPCVIISKIPWSKYRNSSRIIMFRMLTSTALRRSPVTSSLTSCCKANAFAVRIRSFHAAPVIQAKMTVEQLAQQVDMKGTNVLVRVDLNAPLATVRPIESFGFSDCSLSDIYLFPTPLMNLFLICWTFTLG